MIVTQRFIIGTCEILSILKSAISFNKFSDY